MQLLRNAVGVNVVKVLNVVNARPEQLVNSVANGVRVPSVVNARPGQLVNSVANGVRAQSVVNARPEQAVSVDHSLVDVVVREDQVVLCECSL